jgi:multicomponent Na+:H+ antiporter subunit C
VTLLFSLTIGVLFGAGAWLLLKPDLFRVVGGLALVSNAAVLTIIASGLQRGQAPIGKVSGDEPPSDPLVQAMALTAIVIGFAVTALLLVLVVRVYRTHRSVDLDDLSRMEVRTERRLEREDLGAGRGEGDGDPGRDLDDRAPDDDDPDGIGAPARAGEPSR